MMNPLDMMDRLEMSWTGKKRRRDVSVSQEQRQLDQREMGIRHEHRREVMNIWTKRLPWLVLLFAVVALGLSIIGVSYVNSQLDPCARCLDHAHDTWSCAGNKYLDHCIEGRRHEMEQCYKLCGGAP